MKMHWFDYRIWLLYFCFHLYSKLINDLAGIDFGFWLWLFQILAIIYNAFLAKWFFHDGPNYITKTFVVVIGKKS